LVVALDTVAQIEDVFLLLSAANYEGFMNAYAIEGRAAYT